MDNLEEFKQRVAAASAIAEVAGEHLLLKRSGRELKALCPFHQEKTPSFSINPDKGLYHCHGCKAGGDVFALVMKLENLSFAEAVERLAARAGIPVPERFSGGAGGGERRQLLGVLEQATAYYHRVLVDSPEAEPAREYLRTRKVAPHIIQRFRLGYAPESGRALLSAAGKQGIEADLLERAGLAGRFEKGGRAGERYDWFHGRILFPIAAPDGKTIAFGGRVLRDQAGAPKYLNSRETPLFKKGDCLYGLPQAAQAARSSGAVLILEGYMDVLALHQSGFYHAVAPLGTALTQGHLRLLKRYAEHVVLVFDGDRAGTEGTLSGLRLFLQAEMEASVVPLPQGDDPDTYLLREGAAAFKALVSSARSVTDFLTDVAISRADLSRPAGKASVVAGLVSTLAGIQNHVRRHEEIKRLAERIGVSVDAVAREVSRFGGQARPTFPGPSPVSGKEAAEEGLAADGRGVGGSRAEHVLLQLLLSHPELADGLRGQIAPEDFVDPDCAKLIRELFRLIETGRAVTAGELLAHWPEGEGRDRVGRMMAEWTMRHVPVGNPRSALDGLVWRIKRAREEEEFQRLRPEIVQMIEGQTARDTGKMDRYHELARRLKGQRQRGEG